MGGAELGWYAVRCLFRWDEWEGTPYEERMTLWRAGSPEEAIEKAETEAQAYAAESEVRYVDFAQCYRLTTDGPPAEGDEVFSLLRDSSMPPGAYVERYFATGGEHETA